MALPAPDPSPASTRDIVVVGASAGGISAIEELLGGLPEDFPAAVFVVVHTSSQAPGVLAQILTRAGPLRARYAVDGEPVEWGRVYVAPPDRHLLVARGRVRVTRGPKENRFRPAVDPLFRSAAVAYGPRVVGVVLSGMLSDGAAGLWAVKDRGGVAVVQDPAEATFASMPASAMEAVEVDHCLPAAAIAETLAALVFEPAGDGIAAAASPNPGPHREHVEVRIAMEDHALESGLMELGDFSPFACPECHGVLLQLKGEGPLRYRCHTGHAYSAEALLSELGDAIEETVWNAVRAIEERVMLLEKLAAHLRAGGHPEGAERHLGEVEDLKRRLDLVRAAFLSGT